MNKLDYKKTYKDIYQPKTKPSLLQVPPITYVVVEGKGNPNTSIEYKQAIELLYGLSYTIKMSKDKPANYFDYVVPPLEGLWWGEDGYFDGKHIVDKDKFHWLSMIRLPEFVDQALFKQAKDTLKKKKPQLDVDKLEYRVIEEGLCVQVMHIGPFDDETSSVEKIEQFIKDHELENDMSETRLHHEIYLSDFRRAKPENLKTVIRHPVKRKEI